METFLVAKSMWAIYVTKFTKAGALHASVVNGLSVSLTVSVQMHIYAETNPKQLLLSL